MTRKLLVGPFITCFAAWTYGNGTLPLLPLYALDLGASRMASGFFLAFAYLCIAVSTMATGMLPETFRHRRLLLIASGVPLIVLQQPGGFQHSGGDRRDGSPRFWLTVRKVAACAAEGRAGKSRGWSSAFRVGIGWSPACVTGRRSTSEWSGASNRPLSKVPFRYLY
jgi:MFS family permease